MAYILPIYRIYTAYYWYAFGATQIADLPELGGVLLDDCTAYRGFF